MFSLNDSLRYWLWSEPTDMRKSFYSLSGIVCNKMGKDPLDGSVYIFVNRNRDRIKSGSGVGAMEWRGLVVMIEGIIVNGTPHH